jgi:hypothetical protein
MGYWLWVIDFGFWLLAVSKNEASMLNAQCSME